MKIHKMITEKTWCQGANGRDQGGFEVQDYSDEAIRFCMIGWMHRKKVGVAGWKRLTKAIEKRGYEHISEWNDAPERTVKEVRALFKEAGL